MSTLDYYNKNAEKYYKTTIIANMNLSYSKFLHYIPVNGYILDFGCGSGRDSKKFIDLGYKVDALDGSKELCKLASNLLNLTVINKTFEEFNEEDKYDGIWACASLLHVPKFELKIIINKLIKAIKDNGYIYISLKNGIGEEIIEDKYYNYLTKEEIFDFAKDLNLSIVDYWTSNSTINKNEPRYWHSFIIKKEN